MKPGGEVRIIGGQWKRSKLPVANLPGLRPTPDRVRETLFNWLGQDMSGWHCADPFAGTGALGFEAASRGAASVLLGESSSLCIEVMQKNAERLKATGIRLQRGDGLSMLRQQAPNSLDLVFLDPPYDFPHYDSALQSARACLKPGGFVYLESAKAWPADTLLVAGWHLHRHLKAGAVHAHLLQPAA
ncbi:MAG: 16S rRNA (guanine(966)-N(2))-methyltransferase RsmD [Betaproteobacteria bacterium]|nr:16S rRNA (guanine(966)-N(2))-methyltransferase RsmD [Burkholderiales bacterium]